MVYGSIVFLAALLAVLAVWQRRIDRRHEAKVRAQLQDAKDRGADRPIAQYPQIDPQLCAGCSTCIRACPEDGVLGLVHGIAHVINASRCIGHGRCAAVCPLGAITVGLGDVVGRSDLPRLTDALESSVPGVFIAGELGGLALIRNAVTQGSDAIDAIAERVQSSSKVEDVPDVLIVGAGPSGIAASLRAIERGLSYVMIDQDDIGGTVRKYPRRKLVMTQPVALPLHGMMKRTEYRKEDLIELWSNVASEHGVSIRTHTKFLETNRDGDAFVSQTSGGPIRTRFVVLAMGRRGTPRRLGVPGEEHEKVLYRLVDAATYRDLDLLVVGGGDSAIEAATGLADQPGNRVTLSYRKADFFRLKSRNEERIRRYADEGRIQLYFSSSIEGIARKTVVLATAEGTTVPLANDFVFVFAGGEPPYPLLKKIGVRMWNEAVA